LTSTRADRPSQLRLLARIEPVLRFERLPAITGSGLLAPALRQRRLVFVRVRR
jgi:hypothetical protein